MERNKKKEQGKAGGRSYTSNAPRKEKYTLVFYQAQLFENFTNRDEIITIEREVLVKQTAVKKSHI